MIKKQKTIIGIAGKKGHGKDTVGNFLISFRGYKKLSFAEPIKKACQEIFMFTEDQLNGNDKENIDPYWNVTPRQVLQYVGT